MEVRFNEEMIKNFLQENKMSQKQFCKNCGISVYAFRKYSKSSANNCKISVAYKICCYAGWKTNDFLIIKR